MTIAVIRLPANSIPLVCINVHMWAQSTPRSGRLSVFIEFPFSLLVVVALILDQPVLCEGP
jgi:hypothetical protein